MKREWWAAGFENAQQHREEKTVFELVEDVNLLIPSRYSEWEKLACIRQYRKGFKAGVLAVKREKTKR